VVKAMPKAKFNPESLSRRITLKYGEIVTCANTPALALLHWYTSKGEKFAPHNPEPFKVYTRSISHPTKGKAFLDLIMAVCEREFGNGPSGTDGPFMKQCWKIIKWLRLYGDVTELKLEYLVYQ
jgi:hypothetical protein